MIEAKTNTKKNRMRDMRSKLLPLFQFSKDKVGDDATRTKSIEGNSKIIIDFYNKMINILVLLYY